MEVKITSEKQNPMLKRREVIFQVEHGQSGSTPSRLEIRKAVAAALKTDENIVFVKKFETKTGMHIAVGVANIYDTIEQAKLVEPEYIVKRNIPPEPKPKEEEVKG
jgi:small subunit ribosomal protein S24e